jgi:hypothetical protein
MLRRSGELLSGFNPDDRRYHRDFKAAVAFAEVFLHRFAIEPSGNLLGGGDGEVIADGVLDAAALELVLPGNMLTNPTGKGLKPNNGRPPRRLSPFLIIWVDLWASKYGLWIEWGQDRVESSHARHHHRRQSRGARQAPPADGA